MKKSSIFVDLGILRNNRDFRSVFIARTISLLGLGMLSVAIPMQIYAMTGDTLKVGLAMAIEGAAMFVGLLFGGVLADRHERKRLILRARFVCGMGFLGLAVNAWLDAPSLIAVYVLSAWDGFFGALGVTALMACMPAIVGRDNLLRARAISMLAIRLSTVISPAIGGILIASAGVTWNYLVAALGTGLTLIPLLRLPVMQPATGAMQHPLRALLDGMRFLRTNTVVASVALIGALVTLTSTIRVLFPAMAEAAFGGGALEVGMMYSAVPLGATLGAITSGWTGGLRRPGLAMMLLSVAAFLCLMALGLNHSLPLALLLLALFGFLVSIASLLQYALVQGHTPDHYLGRVNGLWGAQDAAGDSVGTIGIGLLGKLMSSLTSIFVLGAGALALGLMMLARFRMLRQAPMNSVELP